MDRFGDVITEKAFSKLQEEQNWKIYIFAINHTLTGRKLSKGKIAGQVAHAAMRLGSMLALNYPDELKDYNHHEVKIVYRVKDLPFEAYHLNYVAEPSQAYYHYHHDAVKRFVSTVFDNTSGRYLALAVMTKENIGDEGYKLL